MVVSGIYEIEGLEEIEKCVFNNDAICVNCSPCQNKYHPPFKDITLSLKISLIFDEENYYDIIKKFI